MNSSCILPMNNSWFIHGPDGRIFYVNNSWVTHGQSTWQITVHGLFMDNSFNFIGIWWTINLFYQWIIHEFTMNNSWFAHCSESRDLTNPTLRMMLLKRAIHSNQCLLISLVPYLGNSRTVCLDQMVSKSKKDLILTFKNKIKNNGFNQTNLLVYKKTSMLKKRKKLLRYFWDWLTPAPPPPPPLKKYVEERWRWTNRHQKCSFIEWHSTQ